MTKRTIAKEFRAKGIKIGLRVAYVNPRFVPDAESIGCAGDFSNGRVCAQCEMPSESHWVGPMAGTVIGFSPKNGLALVRLDIGEPRLLASPEELTLE